MPSLKDLFTRESRWILAALVALVVVHSAWELWVPSPLWLRIALFATVALGVALLVGGRLGRMQATVLRQLDGLAERAERVERLEDSGAHSASGIPQVDRADRALFKIASLLRDHDRLRSQLQALQRQQMVGQLARELIGDLNNRLTVVLAQLDLAREGLSDSDPRKIHLRHAENAANGSVQCAQALLSFGADGRAPAEPLDLNGIVDKVCALLRRVLDDRIRVVLELGAGLPWVQGNATLLEQVVMNLGLNARQAMRSGGTITFRTSRSPEGWAALSVEDTGVGISPVLLERIWQPFFSTRPPEDGVGLGLAAAREILRDHGGRIQVESAPGRGSVFTVLLPPSPIQDLQRPRAEESHRPSYGGLRILLAEDEPEIRMVLKELLSRMGAEVVTGVDGLDAWNLWELLGPFDLLITDQRMPRMDGLELIRRVRGAKRDFPVLVISGYGFEEASELLGADRKVRLLAKPFTVPALVESLSGLALQPSARPGG